jgi:cell division septation protein DedD
MEDFATKEQKGIKEKSIYILHLDTPRIIILTSVIIGLVIIAALIGMNINKQDQKDNESFAHDNAVLENLTTDSSEKPNIMENNIDSPLNSDNILKNKINENSIITADNSLKPKDILPNSQGTNNSINNTTSNEPASDILTHENIETTIIPPAHVMKKSDHKKSIKKSSEKNTDKNKENTKRKGIVEVSSRDKSLKAAEKEKNYFSIQVAAFDKKSKALSEINNLESKKYNAYVDSAKVNGKTFYKVMIGPIYSKKKAVDLLDEISTDKRYEESYIIKR